MPKTPDAVAKRETAKVMPAEAPPKDVTEAFVALARSGRKKKGEAASGGTVEVDGGICFHNGEIKLLGTGGRYAAITSMMRGATFEAAKRAFYCTVSNGISAFPFM